MRHRVRRVLGAGLSFLHRAPGARAGRLGQVPLSPCRLHADGAQRVGLLLGAVRAHRRDGARPQQRTRRP